MALACPSCDDASGVLSLAPGFRPAPGSAVGVVGVVGVIRIEVPARRGRINHGQKPNQTAANAGADMQAPIGIRSANVSMSCQ